MHTTLFWVLVLVLPMVVAVVAVVLLWTVAAPSTAPATGTPASTPFPAAAGVKSDTTFKRTTTAPADVQRAPFGAHSLDRDGSHMVYQQNDGTLSVRDGRTLCQHAPMHVPPQGPGTHARLRGSWVAAVDAGELVLWNWTQQHVKRSGSPPGVRALVWNDAGLWVTTAHGVWHTLNADDALVQYAPAPPGAGMSWGTCMTQDGSLLAVSEPAARCVWVHHPETAWESVPAPPDTGSPSYYAYALALDAAEGWMAVGQPSVNTVWGFRFRPDINTWTHDADCTVRGEPGTGLALERHHERLAVQAAHSVTVVDTTPGRAWPVVARHPTDGSVQPTWDRKQNVLWLDPEAFVA
jgi:hypothetical protein